MIVGSIVTNSHEAECCHPSAAVCLRRAILPLFYTLAAFSLLLLHFVAHALVRCIKAGSADIKVQPSQCSAMLHHLRATDAGPASSSAVQSQLMRM